MRHLFFLGNGFDLAHELPTSYRDFIVWHLSHVWTTIKNNRQSNILYKDLLINVERKNVNFFQNDLLIHDQTVIEKPNDFIKILKANNDLEYNIQELLLRIIELDEQQGWSDIEEIYWDLLNSNELKNASKINQEFGFLKRLLDTYIHKLVFPQILNIDKQSRIFKIFETEINSENTSFLFLNLNYTDTLTSLYKIKPQQNITIINLHGQAGHKANSINFGYSDDEDQRYHNLRKTRNINLLEHIKHSQYTQNSYYQQLTNFINNSEPYKMHILGHSLGFSDRTLINYILEDGDCRSIELHYYRPNNDQNNYDELQKKLSLHVSKITERKLLEKLVPFPESRPIN